MDSHTKKILVLGATGHCGLGVVDRACARRNIGAVTALVRNKERAEKLFADILAKDGVRDKLTIVEGSPDDPELVSRLVEESNIVICSLASFAAPHNIMSTAVKNVIAACESQNRENLRFIMFGVYGIDENGDLPTHIAQSVLGYLSPSKYGPAMEDHKRCLALLKSSTLNYTVFQTAVMVDRPFGSPYMTGETPEDVPGMRLWSKIGILDAADCVLNRVDKNDMKELYMAYAA